MPDQKTEKLDANRPRSKAAYAGCVLTARYRALSGRGKKTTVVCTAIARELAGFMWSVAQEARAA